MVAKDTSSLAPRCYVRAIITQKYPSIEENLEQVIGQHWIFEIVGFSILHVQWSQDPDNQKITKTQDDGWQGRGHQEPVIDARICLVLHDYPVLVHHGAGHGGHIVMGPPSSINCRHLNNSVKPTFNNSRKYQNLVTILYHQVRRKHRSMLKSTIIEYLSID